ncbi:MAG: 4-hydroxythreonine-4-phosphate dehydrogenase PdxA [Henriciella sp.]|nr:4-hydroxythreonine-4-phosphate dehydrogenase PdxA [Henriciella sp.]
MVRPLALTMGDPAGCGPQITLRAWQALRSTSHRPFFVIADPAVLESFGPVVEIERPDQAIENFGSALPVLPLKSTSVPAIQPGEPDEAAADAVVDSIKTATELALAQDVAAVVTNPISKALLYSTGFQFPGHTEYIAHLCHTDQNEAPTPVMMLVGGGLRVALATIHIPLMNVAGTLSQPLLIDIGQKTAQSLKLDFGIAMPRLAFTGLNPHAGESGTIGREEIELINPAADQLRSLGIDISDARPGDTVFAEALSGAYDAVIAMTHDQGLIPVKTLDLWGGVNTTLGLPIIRTSPDHGTAYDAAAAGTAKPDSLIAALKLADTMAKNRFGADA